MPSSIWPSSGEDIAWDLIRLAFASVADMAVVQMQDLLDLDNSARMNTPGVTMGNWTWRYRPEQFDPHMVERLGLLTRIYGRAHIEATPETRAASDAAPETTAAPARPAE